MQAPQPWLSVTTVSNRFQDPLLEPLRKSPQFRVLEPTIRRTFQANSSRYGGGYLTWARCPRFRPGAQPPSPRGHFRPRSPLRTSTLGLWASMAATRASRSEVTPKFRAQVSILIRFALSRRSQIRSAGATSRAGRVEAKRGGVQARRRRQRATSFVVALAEKAIAPSLRPAHRTGRDHLGRPALGRISRQGMRRDDPGNERGDSTPRSPNTTGMGNRR